MNFIAMVVGLGVAAGCACSSNVCQQDYEAQNWAAALKSCTARAASDPDAAITGGRAALNLGEYGRASALARQALGTRGGADAMGLLGAVALGRESFEEAIVLLRVAYVLHTAQDDDKNRVRDVHQLAGAWFQLGEYGHALEATNLLRDLA